MLPEQVTSGIGKSCGLNIIEWPNMDVLELLPCLELEIRWFCRTPDSLPAFISSGGGGPCH